MQAEADPDSESRAAVSVEYQPLVVVPGFTLRQPLGALVRPVARFSATAAPVGEPRHAAAALRTVTKREAGFMWNILFDSPLPNA